MTDESIQDRILAAAERRARSCGYNGFSFRDLADEVGIRSASIHYHFPTKADLGLALVRRYTQRTADILGDPGALSVIAAEQRVADLFREALASHDRMCLCGILGAERDVLPPALETAVADYFRMLLAFLEEAGGKTTVPGRPVAFLARLEGALILARTLRDRQVFEDAVAQM